MLQKLGKMLRGSSHVARTVCDRAQNTLPTTATISRLRPCLTSPTSATCPCCAKPTLNDAPSEISTLTGNISMQPLHSSLPTRPCLGFSLNHPSLVNRSTKRSADTIGHPPTDTSRVMPTSIRTFSRYLHTSNLSTSHAALPSSPSSPLTAPESSPSASTSTPTSSSNSISPPPVSSSRQPQQGSKQHPTTMASSHSELSYSHTPDSPKKRKGPTVSESGRLLLNAEDEETYVKSDMARYSHSLQRWAEEVEYYNASMHGGEQVSESYPLPEDEDGGTVDDTEVYMHNPSDHETLSDELYDPYRLVSGPTARAKQQQHHRFQPPHQLQQPQHVIDGTHDLQSSSINMNNNHIDHSHQYQLHQHGQEQGSQLESPPESGPMNQGVISPNQSIQPSQSENSTWSWALEGDDAIPTSQHPSHYQSGLHSPSGPFSSPSSPTSPSSSSPSPPRTRSSGPGHWVNVEALADDVRERYLAMKQCADSDSSTRETLLRNAVLGKGIDNDQVGDSSSYEGSHVGFEAMDDEDEYHIHNRHSRVLDNTDGISSSNRTSATPLKESLQGETSGRNGGNVASTEDAIPQAVWTDIGDLSTISLIQLRTILKQRMTFDTYSKLVQAFSTKSTMVLSSPYDPSQRLSMLTPPTATYVVYQHDNHGNPIVYGEHGSSVFPASALRTLDRIDVDLYFPNGGPQTLTERLMHRMICILNEEVAKARTHYNVHGTMPIYTYIRDALFTFTFLPTTPQHHVLLFDVLSLLRSLPDSFTLEGALQSYIIDIALKGGWCDFVFGIIELSLLSNSAAASIVAPLLPRGAVPRGKGILRLLQQVVEAMSLQGEVEVVEAIRDAYVMIGSEFDDNYLLTAYIRAKKFDRVRCRLQYAQFTSIIFIPLSHIHKSLTYCC